MAKEHVRRKPAAAGMNAASQSVMAGPGADERAAARWQSAKVALFLALVTAITYSRIIGSDFCYYDDDEYVTSNPHVLHGLSWEGVTWAFASMGYAVNWHPLTWISHMMDVQLFGLDPAGHHFTNLFLHILATLLLFGFLRSTIRELWTAALIAALFALHPMHVESVAWIAERKDVLCAVFGFATLWAYVGYARRPGPGRYAAVLILFGLGLLAKPMLVSLPFVLLLLDYWPMERWRSGQPGLGRLVLEKVPLFLMAAASSVMTLMAQRAALRSLAAYDLPTRAANAVVSYGVYLGQAFWPAKLAVLYPFVRPQLIHVGVCALLLVTITVAALKLGGQNKYLITGWFWYLVTLAPVIGLVQVGDQAHADRYTYIPYVGLFILIAFGLKAIMDTLEGGRRRLANTVLMAVLAVMTVATWRQVRYWDDGITLLSHTIAVTKDNEVAHYNLGNVLLKGGRTDEAILHYQKALEINPNNAKALNNLAGAYYHKDRMADAVPLMQKALALAKAAGDEAFASGIAANLERLKQAMESGRKP